MPTVLSLERHPVAPAAEADLRTLLSELVEAIRAAPGALWAEVAPSADGDAYLVLSEWRTRADLDAFSSGEAASRIDEGGDALRASDVTRRRFRSE